MKKFDWSAPPFDLEITDVELVSGGLHCYTLWEHQSMPGLSSSPQH